MSAPLWRALEDAFDIDFYLQEYPDLMAEGCSPFEHFMSVGWFEGRNPNPFFDTVSYLLRNPDVRIAGNNPLAHYIGRGQSEGRRASPAIVPSVRSSLLLGYPVRDWVAALEGVVDAAFYLTALPAGAVKSFNPVAHFAFRGWREGIDPAGSLRLDDLLRAWPRAAELVVNPLLVELEARAGRYIPVRVPDPPTVLTSPSSGCAPYEPLFAHAEAPAAAPLRDLKLVASEFDARFYLNTYEDVAAAGVDPLDHFFFTGWREGRNPTAGFDSTWYISEYPDVARAGVNPFWHFLAVGRAEGRAPVNPSAILAGPEGAEIEQKLAVMRTEFSPQYYLANNADVAAAGIDPLEHFHIQGWREGRNPSGHFETNYYLAANEDVRDAGINPFWHYLVAGRAEGRAPVRPGGYRRRIIEAAKSPEARSADYQIWPGRLLTRKQLANHLDKALVGRSGVVISLSHDCYIKVIGGTQIFISDEQRRFAAKDFAYVHLSPRRWRLNLAPLDLKFELQIVIDGNFIGFARLELLRHLLADRLREDERSCLFIVHSILGFNEEQVCDLHSAIAPSRSVFWLHDYASLCEGFNLLRNDLDFCNVPAQASMTCRVCVYGEFRQEHLARMQRLFSHCNFDVLSPSAFTLSLWLSRTTLPVRSASVHPHWKLLRKPDGHRKPALGPVKIAFVGFSSPAKGWEIFSKLVDEFADDDRYRFYHFVARGVPTLPECEHVVTEITPDDRLATIRLLQKHNIDFLAMLSPWPETFSFVAHEGMAAGCRLLCLKDSGNVVAAVEAYKLGHVFADATALQEFLAGPEAVQAMEEARADRQYFRIKNAGTTATAVRLLKRPRRR